MPAKLHRIKLSEAERQELQAIRDHKRGNPSRVLRAIALLLSDEGPAGPALKDSEIRLATGMKARGGELTQWGRSALQAFLKGDPRKISGPRVQQGPK